MPSRLRISTSVTTHRISGSKTGVGALLGCAVLLVGMVFLLYAHIGFASYAFTGVFWASTGGTVTTPDTTSAPTVQFATPDGAVHRFSEDYVLLCGGRGSFCMTRDFSHGETVPVVYDPAVPDRAFIHDWALLSNAVTWFLELGCELLLALMLAVAVTRRPLNLQFRLKRGDGPFDDRLR